MEFPDGTLAIDHIEDLIEFQKVFMEVVSDTREVNMFTYPVLTYSLLKRKGITEAEADEMIRTKQYDVFVDRDFARWCSDHNMRWSDANFFVSDDVGVLSNCPVSGDTKILYWSEYYKEFKVSPLKDLYHRLNDGDEEKSIFVPSNGKMIKCRVNRFAIPCEYRIKLVNGAKLTTTANHLNKVYGKNYVQSKDLTTKDYLPFTMTPLQITEDMSYEDGKVIGMFLGDGSYRNGSEVTFSLNEESKEDAIAFIEAYCPSRFHAKITKHICTSPVSGKDSCVNVNVNSGFLRAMVEQFTEGASALDKAISMRVLSCSVDFRRGILDGLYATDGGNANRIYTSSASLRDSLVTMLASMGIAATVSADERVERLGTNPCYTVRWYTPKGKTTRKDVYIIEDNTFWFKIKSITKGHFTDVSYCMEVSDEDAEPVFMLANGVHTHNCRLLSDTKKLDAFINSIGGTALSVGSCRVSTVNLVRIAYESKLNRKKYLEILRDRAELNCKALSSMRHIIKRNIEKGLLPNYQDGAVELSKQFCTIGGM